MKKIAKHTVGSAVAQGDVILIPVDKTPSGEFITQNTENGVYIVTHSETGHHHVIEASSSVELFKDTMDEFRSYLVINEVVDLEHLRNHDTHETISLEPGIWEVRRQREYSPEGWRRATD